MNMRTLLECYKILEEYPNGMTKDQFYRVARINKQHAKYLLDSGLVPCINTGKKTRKYHIATHDVITYLCDREDNPEKYKVPTGFYIGKNGSRKPLTALPPCRRKTNGKQSRKRRKKQK